MALLEELAEEIEYDPDTGLLWWKKRGKGRIWERPAGTIDAGGYLRVEIRGELYFQADLAWALYYGSWPQTPLDHVNGKRARNHILNLREATLQQQRINSSAHKDNASGYKGVSWHRENKKWRASLCRKFLGYFATAREAAVVYDMHVLRKFGEFARTNFVPCEPGM